MLSGVMLLWFVLTLLSVLFVAIDSIKTPESPVLKWGFILLTLYTGPVGAFLYVLGCREPLPGLHEQYTAIRWRQVLGSTMHCVAGDGLGILAGAILGGMISMARPAEIGLEYLLGFGFGWSIFQALFMKESSGGSFYKALKNTFIPELVSMNYLMAAMVVVTTIGMASLPGSNNPLTAEFWFIMSMALLVGFIAAYPINWWLVSNHLKHGMMTVRPMESGDDTGAPPAEHQAHNGSLDAHNESPDAHNGSPDASESAHSDHATPAATHDTGNHSAPVSRTQIGFMVALSFLVFGAAIGFSLNYGA